MKKNEQGKWIIATSEELLELQKNSNLWDDHFLQTEDIDMEGIEFFPIGNEVVMFNGSYDGNGNFIRNLKINCPRMAGVGLFGWTDEKANIQGILLSKCEIIGADAVGGIVGFNQGGRIEFCVAQRSIGSDSIFCKCRQYCRLQLR